MRKTYLSRVVISSLLLLGVGMAATVRLVYWCNSTANQQARPNHTRVSIVTVLQSHSGRHKEWLRFTQEGTLMYHTDSAAGSERVFERRLRLSTDHSFVRYDKATLNRNQSFLSNGQTLVRTTFQAGTQLEVRVLNSFEAAGIKFQIATFGLLPILKRLSDPSTQVVYVGATSKGNQFQVKTGSGSWYFYTNTNHLIDRLEVGDIAITYGDYRMVNGLNLPFFQAVKKGDRLLYEIKFDGFDLNPVFAAGFFKSELL